MSFCDKVFAGIVKILFGASKIITTPLTWFFKIPLQASLHCLKKKPLDDPSERSNTLIYKKINYILDQFAGIGKDFIDTFKPYKAGYHFRRDLLQLLSGVSNVILGINDLIRAIFFTVTGFFPYMNQSIRYAQRLSDIGIDLKGLPYQYGSNITFLLSGLSEIFRGLTQIATTPLTWLIKIPLRGIITAIKGQPRVEDQESIKMLINKGMDLIDDENHQNEKSFHKVAGNIHNKYSLFTKRGQKTNIDQHDEEEQFNNVRQDNTQTATEYIQWFNQYVNI